MVLARHRHRGNLFHERRAIAAACGFGRPDDGPKFPRLLRALTDQGTGQLVQAFDRGRGLGSVHRIIIRDFESSLIL